MCSPDRAGVPWATALPPDSGAASRLPPASAVPDPLRPCPGHARCREPK